MEKELPKYVTRFVDNRGSARLRFRRTSYPTYYFKGKFGSIHFNMEYEACLSGEYMIEAETEHEKARALIRQMIERDGRTPECFVYAIGETTGDAVKIGVAKDVIKRLCGLQVGNPRTLRLYGLRPGGMTEERAAHSELRDSCITGEWFRKPAVRRMFERDRFWLASSEVVLASDAEGVVNAS